MEPINLAVLDFNSVTVSLYTISPDEFRAISDEIGEEDEETVVLEYMDRKGHRESECNWMYSNRSIEVYVDPDFVDDANIFTD